MLPKELQQKLEQQETRQLLPVAQEKKLEGKLRVVARLQLLGWGEAKNGVKPD